MPAYGEFHNVRLTDEQHVKLKSKLDGNLQQFIDRLDRWGEEEPAKFRKKKSHYATILNWYDRDVKEGRIKPPRDNSPKRMPDKPVPVC